MQYLLSSYVWIKIISVEILAEFVHPEVSSVDSIHVYHGNDHKYKHLSKDCGSKVGACQKIYDPHQTVGSRGLPGMDSCSD